LIAFVTGVVLLSLIRTLKGELKDWLGFTWGFGSDHPLLFLGVMIAGALLGVGLRSLGSLKWIETQWRNSLFANFFAALSGLSCILPRSPKCHSARLLEAHGQGPALALLLSVRIVAAQHAGDQHGFRTKENRCFCRLGNTDVHFDRFCVWDGFGIAHNRKLSNQRMRNP
jgi:uncharacterized membrane protein YraQ (UPF0718 family)